MDHTTAMHQAYERISAGDIAGFGELVADDFVEHQGDPSLPATKDGTLEFFRTLVTAFPDWRMHAEDVIVGDDKAAARVTVTGTQLGGFMGLPPTRIAVSVPLIDIMRFDDAGLICEHWGVADMLSLMHQLGAIPAAPTAPHSVE